MALKIRIRRGAKINLPQLAEGEIAFTEDEGILYIGTTTKNVAINDPDFISNIVEDHVTATTAHSVTQISGAESTSGAQMKVDTAKNDLNTRIDNEVITLNGTITTKENTINNTITQNVSTINTRIDTEVSTLNQTITTKDTAQSTALQGHIDAPTAHEISQINGLSTEVELNAVHRQHMNPIIAAIVFGG